jgi:hypothetical protein
VTVRYLKPGMVISPGTSRSRIPGKCTAFQRQARTFDKILDFDLTGPRGDEDAPEAADVPRCTGFYHYRQRRRLRQI